MFSSVWTWLLKFFITGKDYSLRLVIFLPIIFFPCVSFNSYSGGKEWGGWWDRLTHGDVWNIAESPHDIKEKNFFISSHAPLKIGSRNWLFAPASLNIHFHIIWVAKTPTLTFSGDQTFRWSHTEISHCGLQESFPLQAVQCWERRIEKWTPAPSPNQPQPHFIPRNWFPTPFPRDECWYQTLFQFTHLCLNVLSCHH